MGTNATCTVNDAFYYASSRPCAGCFWFWVVVFILIFLIVILLYVFKKNQRWRHEDKPRGRFVVPVWRHDGKPRGKVVFSLSFLTLCFCRCFCFSHHTLTLPNIPHCTSASLALSVFRFAYQEHHKQNAMTQSMPMVKRNKNV